jgi:radical SAM superfamily enzyme YgiQ (UPF0313 family)
MRIYLADLSHLTDWNNTAVMPLCVGYVASYLKKHRPDVTIEIHKHPERLLKRIQEAPPDILALSQYTWNVRLNYALSKRAKQINPNTTIVMGGPHFDASSPDHIKKMFRQRPQLDLFLNGEGEWNFTRLVNLMDVHGMNVKNIPIEEWPDSFYGYDPASDTVLNNVALAADRADLPDIPSPYLTGLFDDFLKEGSLQPIIETARGCPYTCTFCSWGATTKSKMHQFPKETVFAEIDYIVERNNHPSGFLFIADGNFGILKRDLEISEKLRDCSEKKGFPKSTYVYYAKNSTERVLKIAENIKASSTMSMSKQSLHAPTLELIKRKNISNEKYDQLQVLCEQKGIETYCELIYGLPGETYETFTNGLIESLRRKNSVYLQVLRMDIGSELSSTKSIENFGYRTAFRVLSRSVGSYGDLHSMEYDEIAIENKYMSREDFRKIRLIHFILFILTQDAFAELRRGLEVYKLDYGALMVKIVDEELNWTPKFGEIIREFQAASENELLTEEQTKLEFTEEDVNCVSLDEIALNPLFMATMVSSKESIEDFHKYLGDALVRNFRNQIDEEALADLNYCLDLSISRLVCYEQLTQEKEVNVDFDIESWKMSDPPAPLRAFRLKEPRQYKMRMRDGLVQAFEKCMREKKDIIHSVYWLRVHVQQIHGDRIFQYYWV